MNNLVFLLLFVATSGVWSLAIKKEGGDKGLEIEFLDFGKQILSGVNKFGPEPILLPNQTLNHGAPIAGQTVYKKKVTAKLGEPPLEFNGGRVNTHYTRTHLIFYGDNFNNVVTMEDINDDLLDNIDNSWWWGLVEQYDNGKGDEVEGINNRDFLEYDFNLDFEIDNNEIEDVIKYAINNGYGSGDSNDIYLIVLDRDRNYAGLCTESCSYHQSVNIKIHGEKKKIYFAVIGSPYHCLDNDFVFSTCSRLDESDGNAPNGDTEADSAANQIALQVAAIVTNPDGDGWHDSNGVDLSTKCAWDFGNYVYENGDGVATEEIGIRDYYIGNLWNRPRIGDCYCNVAACMQGFSWLLCMPACGP